MWIFIKICAAGASIASFLWLLDMAYGSNGGEFPIGTVVFVLGLSLALKAILLAFDHQARK